MENIIVNKYKEKVEIIEAIQYNGNNGWHINRWSEDSIIASPVLEPTKDNPTGKYLQIYRKNGNTLTAIVSDYIVKDVKGQFHSYRSDVFESLYEIIQSENKGGEKNA